MSSFDYELKDHLRRAGAPVIDYAEPDALEMLDSLVAGHRRLIRITATFCLAAGFHFGILATLAVQHIFGAA